jgi:hypothetical protein
MTNIQTLTVEPATPELAICARWRANAFSVLQASFEQELRSMELFASDQSHGVALVAKADGEPVGSGFAENIAAHALALPPTHVRGRVVKAYLRGR